jgi:hypothetical protein
MGPELLKELDAARSVDEPKTTGDDDACCGDENMGPELLQELGGVSAGMQSEETRADDEHAAEGTACCTGKLGGNNC